MREPAGAPARADAADVVRARHVSSFFGQAFCVVGEGAGVPARAGTRRVVLTQHVFKLFVQPCASVGEGAGVPEAADARREVELARLKTFSKQQLRVVGKGAGVPSRAASKHEVLAQDVLLAFGVVRLWRVGCCVQERAHVSLVACVAAHKHAARPRAKLCLIVGKAATTVHAGFSGDNELAHLAHLTIGAACGFRYFVVMINFKAMRRVESLLHFLVFCLGQAHQ